MSKPDPDKTVTLTEEQLAGLVKELRKQPAPDTYRRGLEPVPGSGKEHFADALSTVDAKNLHARARIPAVFSMATHNTLGHYLRKDKTFVNNQGVEFNMATLSGLMADWDFEYEATSIGLDGKGREEVRDVLKLAAIGGGDESGVIASLALNEGNKNLSGKSAKTS